MIGEILTAIALMYTTVYTSLFVVKRFRRWLIKKAINEIIEVVTENKPVDVDVKEVDD
jgi:hypothetical protein